MSKTRKVTFNMLAANMPDTGAFGTTVVKVNDDIELTVTRMLDMEHSVAFVNEIVNSCIDPMTGNYNPEVFEFVMRVTTLMFYAGIQQPNDVDKAYNVVFNTDIYNTIMGHIDVPAYADLIDAAKKRIEYMRDIYVAERASIAHTLLERIDKMIGDSDALMDELNGEEFKAALENMVHVLNGGENTAVAEQQPETTVDIAESTDTKTDDRSNVVVFKRGE